jgi:hypothetical protein
MRKLALAVLMVSGVAGFMGCGSSPHKVTTGTAGHGGNGGGTAGATAGSGGGTAGDMGMAGSMAGMAGSTAGAGGMAGGAAGAGGMAGSAAGAGGTAGDGTAGTTPPPPPPITSGTTVIELDDVFVSMPSTGNADGGVDAADDGGAADAGDGGVDAGPSQAVSYTFDTTTQNWKFTPYGSTNPMAPNDPNNLARTSTLVWSAADDADGKSTSGVLKGTVGFQHDGDQIDFQAFSIGAGMYDWTGMSLTAKVKVASGGNLRQNCPLTAVFYISDSNNYNTRISSPINLVVGQWVTVTWTAADATTAGVNVASVSQMGLQINTGAASACTGPFVDAGTDAPADAPADHPADGGTADAPSDTAGQ